MTDANSPVSADSAPTSYLFRGGAIYTMDPAQPWAQSVVVRGHDIVHVGPEAGARTHTDDRTEVVDLAGGMLLPGFVDAHDHLSSLALFKLGVKVSGIVGRDAVLDHIARWIAEQPADVPLRGHGWMPDSFVERSPRREWLDAITGDRPMVLISADGHDLWFNTAAMHLAGIGAATPDPEPGSQFYVRDSDGTPTGHALEGAGLPLLAAMGYFTEQAIVDAQALTLHRAPSWGITTASARPAP